MPERAASITTSKIDAARRQIETAIALWFNEGDPVSIRTLVAAGHHICHDIIKDRGEKSAFLLNPELVQPDKWIEFKQSILSAENFFKHAEREPDPNKTFVFYFEVNEPYIVDAIDLFQRVHGNTTPLMRAFWFRFVIFNPDLCEAFPVLDEPVPVDWREIPKSAFLEKFLEATPGFRRA